MASRFWVGGAGTWDGSTTTPWAATSGGAGGQTVPGSSDDVTFDGSSGGGTVTVNFGGTVSINSLTCSAHTGTIDFATNNNNVTIAGNSAYTNTGSATRTFNMGNGTWTLSGTTAAFSLNGNTNLTFSANSSNLVFSGGVGAKRVFLGSKTLNTITVNASATLFFATNSGTVTTLTVAAPNRITVQSGVTITVTNFTNVSGSSSSQVLLTNDSVVNGIATISSANNWTGDYCAIAGLTFSGGGTFAATNSFSGLQTTGITITGPTGGGAVGVIGG